MFLIRSHTKLYRFCKHIKKIDIRKLISRFNPQVPKLTMATGVGGLVQYNYDIRIDQVVTDDANLH